MKVPSNLRDQLSQKHEITRTLRTKDRREAERRLPFEIAKLRQHFQQLRASVKPLRAVEELRPEDIERLKAQWMHEWLDSDEDERAAGLTHAAYENTKPCSCTSPTL